jgi:RNA polymerase sigma factor (sigma-70 family)
MADAWCAPVARSDEQLVTLLRQGDQEAFAALVARYHPRLLRFCRQILRSTEDAEDALQDVFAAAFRAIVADDREIHVRPWLYRIAKNRCLSKLRSARAIRQDPLDEDHPDHGRGPSDVVVSRQRFRELLNDVEALPDTQRTALLLREIDGFAYQQIAVAMETTVPGVKSLLVRARAGLRSSAVARDTAVAGAKPSLSPCRKRPHSRQRGHAASYKTARAVAGTAR